MPFNEWLKQSLDTSVTSLEKGEAVIAALNAAWEAGYDQGYEDGVEEVMAR